METLTKQLLCGLLYLFTAAVPFTLKGQPKENYTVAIFLYQGVELLDFAGPGEVFSAAGFRVYTVSVDGNEIVSQRFVNIKPAYSIDNAPTPDIVVLPGGNSTPSANDGKVLDWIRNSLTSGSIAMSVCTGAEILGNAGMLKGLNVTTFHGFIPGLQAMLPDSKVLPDTRFVDNGNIITTAGVSAGIDGALHLVARIKGTDVAKATAFYMEYDKWKPEDGRVDFRNHSLQKLAFPEKNGNAAESKTVRGKIPETIPFEGELKAYAAELSSTGSYEEAERVLHAAIKWYPRSIGSYNELSRVYRKQGKPSPPEEAALISLLTEGKIDEASEAFDIAQRKFPGWLIFDEDKLNMMGYHFLEKQDYTNALKIFQLNAKAYPKSSNAFDSLGEVYMKAGNRTEAIANYKKSLEMNPSNNNATEMLKKLQEEK